MYTYTRHKPEETLLYKLVTQYYPQFLSHLAEQGRPLPDYVRDEFEAYLRCGLLTYGFFRVRCNDCANEQLVAFSCKKRGFCPSCCGKRMVESAAHMVDEVFANLPIRQWILSFPIPLRFLFASKPAVMNSTLKIVYRAISGFLLKKFGLKQKSGATGAVTLIQRFGSALNLNVHFHMLFIDGVYRTEADGMHFIPFKEFSSTDLSELVSVISHRIAQHLERKGYIERDAENSYLVADFFSQDEMSLHRQSSVSYRIAIGPMTGKKVFSLQTVISNEQAPNLKSIVAKANGFSLHAGVAVKRNQHKKLEHVCRYITRPPLATSRLSLTKAGNIRYELKTPYQDGTTHVVFEPLDFISKLAALVPVPRVNLTRFHGLFAPNCKLRSKVVKARTKTTNVDRTNEEKRIAMNWAQRLKRAFDIDISSCRQCKGKVRIIACIEDPIVINKILDCLLRKEPGEFSLTLSNSNHDPPLKCGNF